jgi:hypothetical protein
MFLTERISFFQYFVHVFTHHFANVLLTCSSCIYILWKVSSVSKQYISCSTDFLWGCISCLNVHWAVFQISAEASATHFQAVNFHVAKMFAQFENVFVL